MQARRDAVTIVVGERGSDWSAWAERLREQGAHVEVLVQHREESPSGLAMRVRNNIAQIENDGRRLERAVIAGGGRTDRDAVAARSLAIRAMAAEMVKHGSGEVLLDDIGEDRFSMRALAVTVSEMVRGTGVSISHVVEPELANVA